MDVDPNGAVAPSEQVNDWDMESADGLKPSDDSEASHSETDNLRVGYVYEQQMMMHSDENTSSAGEHPEQPARIKYIYEQLQDNNCLVRMRKLKIRKATRDEVLLVHTEMVWNSVMMLKEMTPEQFAASEAFYESDSLYVHPQTPVSARLSCGGVIEATLAVARGELDKTFAIVRPPGHHAEPNRPMGFCFFNNVAIAVKIVRDLTDIKKILILDWDVHHGNGTQKAFNDDPNVLYISLHRYEGGRFYPSGPFGSMTSSGEGAGLGFSVNIPWPEKGTGDADYIHAFQRIVMPIASEYAPELVIISAGFDAAEGDHLGECKVTPAGYAHMTHMLLGLAGGKVVVALEGGYNLDATAKSALAVGRTLLGEAPPLMGPLVASESASETVFQVATYQSQFWNNLDPKACEPKDEIEEHTFSIPELLKEHRQAFMYREYGMLEIPLLMEEAKERYSEQVMCTKDMFDNDTLVLFVHELGDIRAEVADSRECNVQKEHSYLVDASKQLCDWIFRAEYALVDINLLPKPTPANKSYKERTPEQYAREVMTYLWDNYLFVVAAKHIILMGHGAGVLAVKELLEARTANMMRKVDIVIQIVGHANVPLFPNRDPETTRWYFDHSLVIVPTKHLIRGKNKNIAYKKRHGYIYEIDEPRAIKLIGASIPIIQAAVRNAIAKPR